MEHTHLETKNLSFTYPDGTQALKNVNIQIKKGEKIGTATVFYAGREIATTDLVASKNVSRSIILAIGGAIAAIWSSVIGKIIVILLLLLGLGYAGFVIYNKKIKKI